MLQIGPVKFSDAEVLEGLVIAANKTVARPLSMWYWGLIGAKDAKEAQGKYFDRLIAPPADGAMYAMAGRKLVELIAGGQTIYDLVGIPRVNPVP